MDKNEFNLYKDIQNRTDGNIYMGVVGPVRTGKSTFIKRFMDIMVIPYIEDINMKGRVMDQLPQSGDGRTITTTEPKFVPEEGSSIKLNNGMSMSIRAVDCVGFLIPGAFGHLEEGKIRMVKTPWDEEEIPFEEAAEIGTEKVIEDHSTVGILVTTDGTIGEISRESYIKAEEKTVDKLKKLGKPFVIVLNTTNPKDSVTRNLSEKMENKYHVPVIACDCLHMSVENVENIFTELLREFPITEVLLNLPGYLEALSEEHRVKCEIIDSVTSWMNELDSIGNIDETMAVLLSCPAIKEAKIKQKSMATGVVSVDVIMKDGLYYNIIGELMNHPVKNDKELFMLLKEYSLAKEAYDDIATALEKVNQDGYGIVHPKLSQMILGNPEVFKHGNKYGVRLIAKAPCLHIIKTDITTEVSPVVGTQQQSEDLASYLTTQFDDENNTIWETNLFGKTLEELVVEQMDGKLGSMPINLQIKVRKSLQKISDEGKDFFICIIL